jgi:large subunit ribosomal protein L25
MDLIKIAAKSRNESGKGNSRRLRAEGLVPAVVYGLKKDAKPLSLDPVQIQTLLKSAWGRNCLGELTVDSGEQESVLVKDVLRHPVSRDILHVDLIRVDPKAASRVEVPLRLTGRANGVVMGGTQRQTFRTVPVRCIPADVPVEIVFDMTKVKLNEIVHASSLPLPEGVEICLRPEQTVAAVIDERRGPKEGEGEVDPKAAGKKKK